MTEKTSFRNVFWSVEQAGKHNYQFSMSNSQLFSLPLHPISTIRVPDNHVKNQRVLEQPRKKQEQ